MQEIRDYRKYKHFREGGTMKKMILVLMVVLTLGMIGKGMYTALAKLDTNQDAAIGYTLVDAYPCEMPATVMEPYTAYVLF
jgi:hypothetical protein